MRVFLRIPATRSILPCRGIMQRSRIGGNRLASLFQDERDKKSPVPDRRMDRAARLRVNQGDNEGVDYCP